MKRFTKKLVAVVGMITLAVATLQAPVEVQAAPAAKKVEKAYIDYLKKQIKKKKYLESIERYLYDFNKDGIKELVICDDSYSARADMDVYTYKNNKVVSLVKDASEVGYISGTKNLVTYSSGGAYDNNYKIYNIKKGKLKLVSTYACVSGKYNKDGVEITRTDYANFGKTVITDFGVPQVGTKYHYSPEELGFTVYGSGSYTKISKATAKKITYYGYTLGEESTTTSTTKKKSAKITGKTKFYYGDFSRLSTAPGKNMDEKKWVEEITKKEFLKYMKSYSGSSDKIAVKKGKVTKVIIHVQVAG